MPIDINSAHPLSPIIFSPLSLLRSQLYAHESGNINARENCNKEPPAPMETEGLNLPGFGWTAPKCGRGCDCTDKEKRPPGDHVDSPPEAATTAAPDGIPMIVNSTELRSIVPAANLVEVFDGIWRLSRTAEEEALSWCR